MKKYLSIFLSFIFLSIFIQNFTSPLQADGLSGNIRICRVTSLQDNVGVVGSLRRALDQGYSLTNPILPGLCADKIQFGISGVLVLTQPINLNNVANSNFTLEKDPTVSGELVLDASHLPEGSCAISVASNRVTLQGITVQGARGAGVCLERATTGNILTNLNIHNNRDGVWVKSGSQGNTLTLNNIYDNSGYGVNLDDATQNRVSMNALYRNAAGPLDSPATQFLAQIDSAAPINSAATRFTLSGSIPSAVDHVEFFRSVPTGSASNFIVSETSLTAQHFLTSIDAHAGEDIFAIAIASDGSTGPSSHFTHLTTISTTPTPGGMGMMGMPGIRPCFPGQVFDPHADFDGDGIPDVIEDRNANCIVDPDETDPANPDTDGDGIPDGAEDRNHNGVVDANESDPRLIDTDGDRIPDGVEDRNHNGIHEPDELNPTLRDTDGDGIPDNIEDANHNGIRDIGETDGTLVDTDLDGIPDGVEDANHNGRVDPLETDPRLYDTDGDGIPDDVDRCPKNPNPLCVRPCVVGEVPPETLDTDGDGIPDAQEDFNHDCIREPYETDVYNRDTDGDGLLDSEDPCPLSSEAACISTCVPGAHVPPTRDSDGDGIPDVLEDLNNNCFVDPGESNPFSADTDGDGIRDNIDPCPLDPNPLCAHECIPGVLPPEDQDSDGDGLTDREEDFNHNCIVDGIETNFRDRDTDHDGLFDNIDPCPLNPDLTCVSACIPGAPVPARRDSDHDGIPDILEDVDNNCIRSLNETDAFNADTDGDGIPDGVEDKNHNGIVDPGETDPRNPDSDGDGIPDGLEDKNHNGIVDFGELNPLSTDTDGDGIPDNIEDTNLNGVFDHGETNGALADTDRDGIPDGVEDKNHNGHVDAGETDPRNPDTDGDGATDGQEVSNGTSPLLGSSSDFNRAAGTSGGGCSLNQNASFNSSGFGLLLVMGLCFFWRKRFSEK